MSLPEMPRGFDGFEPIPVDLGAGRSLVDVTVPCLYCRGPVPALSFAYWSETRRLLSAACPGCSRRVTLTAATWSSWTEPPYHHIPA